MSSRPAMRPERALEPSEGRAFLLAQGWERLQEPSRVDEQERRRAARDVLGHGNASVARAQGTSGREKRLRPAVSLGLRRDRALD